MSYQSDPIVINHRLGTLGIVFSYTETILVFNKLSRNF